MALLLDTQGFIAEGATESIFLVKEGRLMAPSLGTILRSITRKSLPAAARSIGIDTVEARLPGEFLYEADEIFFSATSYKVLPVRQVEERVLEEVPGPVSRRLLGLMEEIALGRNSSFREWLFPVR